MKNKIDAFTATWKADKLWMSLSLCWLATVAASFFGPHLLRVTVPGLGSMFLFRFLLPVTALLYILWAVRERENPWKDAPAVEKWTYVFIVVLILHSTVSLFWAIDFGHSFSKLFNLCCDLCFFFLMLRLCRDKRLLNSTLWISIVMMLVLAAMGVYEVFNGRIFSDTFDARITAVFFTMICHYPFGTSSNPNDYAAMLLFIAAAIFLLWARGPEPLTHIKLWAVILSMPLLLFVVETASARLCKVGFVLLLMGVLIWLICRGRRLLWAPAVMLLLVMFVYFGFHYNGASSGVLSNVPLHDQFFTVDDETGEEEFRTNESAGVRALLLIHSFNCFRESYGLGVGLGNTETLAARRAVIPQWKDNPQNSIHCFAARIASDYGLFAVIPLCAIGLLLFKRARELFSAAMRGKDRAALGLPLLFLFVLLVYPFVSTAPADAQDTISMWMYLASLVLFCVGLEENHKPVRSRN